MAKGELPLWSKPNMAFRCVGVEVRHGIYMLWRWA